MSIANLIINHFLTCVDIHSNRMLKVEYFQSLGNIPN